jgi:aspartate aminotransferase
MQLSRRASQVSLSITLALDAKAKALADSGRDVVNMSVGEPDFDTPRVAQDAGVAMIRSGAVHYTPAAGTSALRAAIAAYVEATRGGRWTSEEIAVCHSTKHALSGAVQALVDPGDEVLLLLPAWVSYVEIVKLAGGVPVEVPARRDCGPDFAAIQAAITARTKAVLLNSPSNPTGYVWSKAEIERLGRICAERDLWLISDEIYRRLVYEGDPNPSPASLGAAVRERTVVLDGASKAYAMTGWRIGFVAAPKPVAAAVTRLHSHLVGAPNTVSQAAYLAALKAPGAEPEEVARMVAQFDQRRRFLLDELARMGLEMPFPRGAFYAFPSVAPYLDARGSVGFCQDLLEAESLALVPGAAFGVDTHVRLSYATSMEKIAEAARRLSRFLAARGPRAQPTAAGQSTGR